MAALKTEIEVEGGEENVENERVDQIIDENGAGEATKKKKKKKKKKTGKYYFMPLATLARGNEYNHF